MKAIHIKSLPPTNTRPRRIKAVAEGVPPITRSVDEIERQHGTDTYDETCKALALELCEKYGWGQRLAGGVLANGDRVFCFIPRYAQVEADRDELSNLIEDEDAGNDEVRTAAINLLCSLNNVDAQK